MENYVSAQLLLLGQAALLGMLGGVVYDLLRPLRRGRLIHLTDALFTGGGLVLMVWFLTAVSRGEARLFLLLGACGGTDSLWYCIEQKDGVLLRQLDAQGEPTEIEDITLGQTYPMDMALDGEGYLYVLCAEQILVYNSNGKNVSSLKLSDGMGTRLAALENGQIVLTSSTAGSGHAVRLLNTESIGKDLTEADSQFIAYSGYMALLSGGGNLYAMNTDNNEMEILLNWVDSGVYPGILIDCVAADAEKIWYVTSSENGMKLGALKRVEASKLPQRETIDIGVSGSVDTALTARHWQWTITVRRNPHTSIWWTTAFTAMGTVGW